MAEALLALGGNVGNSRAILDRAIALLCDGKEVRLIARSSDYRTPPWGFKYQPHFVNLAIAVETTLGPHELLARAQEVELQLGRDRAHEKRNGPRTADIDIIAYDDVTLNEPNLTLPHPRLVRTSFRAAAAGGNRWRPHHCRAAGGCGRPSRRRRRYPSPALTARDVPDMHFVLSQWSLRGSCAILPA